MTRIVLAAFALFTSTLLAEPPRAVLDAKHSAFLKDNCLTCHNAEKQKGKVRLDDIAFTLDSVEKADLWQKVLNSINSGEMPPEDEKQPDAAAKTDFLDDLSRTLVTARTALSDSGGKITMRRLNRREYKNTIRDLLGVDMSVRELPADGGAGTFDTVGSSLFMSSDQLEQYLALGRQALDEHFARTAAVAPSLRSNMSKLKSGRTRWPSSLLICIKTATTAGRHGRPAGASQPLISSSAMRWPQLCEGSVRAPLALLRLLSKAAAAGSKARSHDL